MIDYKQVVDDLYDYFIDCANYGSELQYTISPDLYKYGGEIMKFADAALSKIKELKEQHDYE